MPELDIYIGNMPIPPTIANPATPPPYRPLTPEEALLLLPPGNTIHTNHQTSAGQMFGMDADPLDIIMLIAAYPCQASGPIATYTGHGLAIETTPITFVATQHPLLPQEIYGQPPTRCPACKTALETQTISHADATTNHLRQLCTNCGAQWWHDKPQHTYSDLVAADGTPLT